ncbi:MAG: fumarylacetoacetate hydrolase family protein [Kiritimatiellia bacterium]|jgi:2,4-diketo-3-deoxy-L-fuconate hydrolase
MKLVRFGEPGNERPGVLVEEPGASPMILDVRGMAYDLEDYNEDFFRRFGMARLPGLLSESGRKLVRAEGVRLGPPVARPGKIICLGKNYADHAMEFDSKVPQTPILFSKAATAVTGPYDPICLPPDAEIVDLEAELAVVIGREARCVPEDRALDYIVGYTILNDVTDRVAQRTDGQWFRSKSLDTFCPLGPWLVTPDEAGDPGNLRVESKLNGVILQNGNTADMIFKIPFLIAYISATITLLPGDVIATGTPAGIGSARRPPLTLHPGDTVEVAVEKLGRQMNAVR